MGVPYTTTEKVVRIAKSVAEQYCKEFSTAIYNVKDYGIDVSKIYEQQTISGTSLIDNVFTSMNAGKVVEIECGDFTLYVIGIINGSGIRGFTMNVNYPVYTEEVLSKMHIKQFIMFTTDETDSIWFYDNLESGGGGSSSIERLFINDAEIIPVTRKATINTDGKSILYEGDTTKQLKLPDTWIEYLEAQTYATPTTTLGGTTSSVEYGAKITKTKPFNHKETNISNIKGNVSLLRNGSVVLSDIEPTTTSTTIQYDVSETVTSSIVFKLTCIDTKGTERESNSLTYTCYKPCWFGGSQLETLTSIDSLTKKASSTLGTVSFETQLNDYAYFVVSGTISKITSGGFDVPFSKTQTLDISLNGITVTYNVYRTNKLDAGSNTFTIS